MPSLRTIILDAIKKEDDYNPNWTETQSFRWLLDYALRCKKYDYEKYGSVFALKEFFIGIGIHIPIWTDEIKKLGYDDDTYWTDLALTVLREVD
tara:strand:+ start:22 stop:303 length:282 start_codon:yes stop_codon:yes gene_type:complete